MTNPRAGRVRPTVLMVIHGALPVVPSLLLSSGPRQRNSWGRGELLCTPFRCRTERVDLCGSAEGKRMMKFTPTRCGTVCLELETCSCLLTRPCAWHACARAGQSNRPVSFPRKTHPPLHYGLVFRVVNPDLRYEVPCVLHAAGHDVTFFPVADFRPPGELLATRFARFPCEDHCV